MASNEFLKVLGNDFIKLRAETNSNALKKKFSNDDVYKKNSPLNSSCKSLYSTAEKIRCESLGGKMLQGIKKNYTDNYFLKIQIASSSKKVKTESYNFKGLKDVERVKVGAHYKYYYGKTSDYLKVKEYQNAARVKGFKTAFIVAFKGGQKVSVKEVLNSN